jgi:hypothetical protein
VCGFFPLDQEAEVTTLVEELGLTSQVTLLRCQRVWMPNVESVGQLAYRVWGLEALGARYRDFHGRIEALHRSPAPPGSARGDGGDERAQMLVTYLFEHYKHCAPSLTKGHFEHWRQSLDNWEMTDGLGWVLALWLLGGPAARLGYLGELIADEDGVGPSSGAGGYCHDKPGVHRLHHSRPDPGTR